MTHTILRSTSLVALFALSTSALAKNPKARCDVDDLVDDYIAAFNSHDTAELAAVLGEDLAVTSPYGAFDRDGWIALSAGAWYAMPDIRWSVDQIVADDDRIAIEYSFTGTFTNDFLGFVASGQAVVGRGMEINRFDEDTCEIVQTWNYSDAYGFFAQLQ